MAQNFKFRFEELNIISQLHQLPAKLIIEVEIISPYDSVFL